MISSPIWRNADLGHSHQLGNSDCILMQKKTIPPACFLSSTSLVKSTTLVLLFTFSLGHHQPGYSCSILMQGEAISYNASPCNNANLSWKEFAFSFGDFCSGLVAVDGPSLIWQTSNSCVQISGEIPLSAGGEEIRRNARSVTPHKKPRTLQPQNGETPKN